MTTFVNLLQMSPNNAGHCQLPVMQTQTTTDAWIRHKRALEDALKKGRMDITTQVSLTFDKASSHANDKRCVNHQCLFVTALDHQQSNGWLGSSTVSKGVVGPCLLIRVSDMQGFDPDNRFGAASRTEQWPGSAQLFKAFLRLTYIHNIYFQPVRFLFPKKHKQTETNAGRKGVPAHTEIIASYLRGIDWQDGDMAIFADCLPNRPKNSFECLKYKI